MNFSEENEQHICNRALGGGGGRREDILDVRKYIQQGVGVHIPLEDQEFGLTWAT